MYCALEKREVKEVAYFNWTLFTTYGPNLLSSGGKINPAQQIHKVTHDGKYYQHGLVLQWFKETDPSKTGMRLLMLRASSIVFYKEARWDPICGNGPGSIRPVHVVVYRHNAGGLWCVLVPTRKKWVVGEYTEDCPFQNPFCLYGKVPGGGHRCKNKKNHVPISQLEAAIYRLSHEPQIKLHCPTNMIILDPTQCGNMDI